MLNSLFVIKWPYCEIICSISIHY